MWQGQPGGNSGTTYYKDLDLSSYGQGWYTVHGIAYDKAVVAGLKEACEWIAPFTVYPGEDELLALVQGGLRVMNKEEAAKEY